MTVAYVWRPSCVVNITLRFDPALTLEPERAPIRFGPGDAAPLPAPIPILSEPDVADSSYIVGRVPKSCSVSLPQYRQAGTFSVTFDFRDLPIDPRTVRAASVEIHMGAVSDQDFADGIRGQRHGANPKGTLKSVLDVSKQDEETTVLTGGVDEWTVDHAGTSTVTLSGRDLRGFLIDIPLSAGVGDNTEQTILDSLNTDQPITKVVEDLLTWCPAFDTMRVAANAMDWPDYKIPKPAFTNIVPRHRQGADGDTARVGAGGDSGSMSFWDLITKLCFLVGAIPYFQGNTLYIRPSRTLYDQLTEPLVTSGARIPTPFRSRRERVRDEEAGVGIPPLRWRQVVYGRTLKSLQFSRKYSGFRRPRTVRAISTNPLVGEIRRELGDVGDTTSLAGVSISGVWPPNSDALQPQNATTSTAGGKTREDTVTIPVPGISDPARLTEIARAVYEELGRGEISGSISTTRLASFAGGPEDCDMLRLRPGDGIEILVDARALRAGSPLVSTLNASQQMSYEAYTAALTDVLGDANLAAVIAATSHGRLAQAQRYFRVESVQFDWSSQSGLKVDAKVQNYVVARSEVTANDPASVQARITGSIASDLASEGAEVRQVGDANTSEDDNTWFDPTVGSI
jgi:hypothetical protein